ncbi:hypothetical protein FOVSG1_013835 [Fusarium oxysporum f. sp. vasinfectum]
MLLVNQMGIGKTRKWLLHCSPQQYTTEIRQTLHEVEKVQLATSMCIRNESESHDVVSGGIRMPNPPRCVSSAAGKPISTTEELIIAEAMRQVGFDGDEHMMGSPVPNQQVRVACNVHLYEGI